MLRYEEEIDSQRYDDLSMSERCDGLRIARDVARDDHERNWMQIPYQDDDPRYDAYLNERNVLRTAAGKRPFHDPRLKKS